MSSNQKLSNAGIAEKSTGERFIPSSKRPDGTFRKEIKVRPGFTPMEDTATYKSQRAEAWRNRGTGGVTGATEVVGAGPSSRDNNGAAAAAAGGSGNRRRRRGRGKRSSTGGKSGDEQQGSESEGENKPVGTEVEAGKEKAASKEVASGTAPAAAAAEAAKPSNEKKDDTLTEEQARDKQVKAVRKKIRQAAELRDRKNNGEKLLPEQIEKALKLNELVRELEKLGFKV